MSRFLPATAFVGAVLAFSLPFGAVSSCDGEEVRFTGAELATFSVPPDRSTAGGLHSDVDRRAGLLALVAALAGAVGAALSAIGRRGTGWCAAIGLVSLQLTAYAIATTSDSADLFVGYWLALGLFAVVGVALLMQELGARTSARRSIWPALALALAVVLPPLGLSVVFLLWLLSLIARALRGLHTERYV
jgi:hypothetical protein